MQLAKLSNAKVIATGSSAQKLQIAQKLGADIAINYSEPGWPEKLLEANGGEKVDYVLEMVGGDIYTRSFNCLKAGGTMIVYGAASGEKGLVHFEHFVDESHNLLSFNLAYFVQHERNSGKPPWRHDRLSSSREITVEVSHSYPLEDAVRRIATWKTAKPPERSC